MKKAFSRGIAATVLGTTLAVGGLALAATPASAAIAAPTLTTPAPTQTFTDYGPNGSYLATGPAYTFAEPIKSVTYTATLSGTNTYFHNTFWNTPIPTFDANGEAVLDYANWTITIKKISETQYQFTKDYVTPGTVTTLHPMRVYSSAPSAQATVSFDILKVTPVSTGVSENLTNEPVASATLTWGTVFTTPVIAPAIAGIALLGAAGTAGGILVGRRKKQQTA